MYSNRVRPANGEREVRIHRRGRTTDRCDNCNRSIKPGYQVCDNCMTSLKIGGGL